MKILSMIRKVEDNMHAPSKYELYLLSERRKYYSKKEDIPSWLIHEQEVYYWIFRLDREMGSSLEDCMVSSQLLERLENIETIRFTKYQNISPVLPDAIKMIIDEFVSLREDLNSCQMWEKRHTLSELGWNRWRKARNIIDKARHCEPDPDWREKWKLQYHVK